MQRTQTKTDQSKLKTKGHPDGKRRYPAGVFPLYDKTYNRLAQDSVILNDRKRTQDMRNSAALVGISECKSTLMELQGAPGKDGYYKRGQNAYKALIPSAKEQLQDAHIDFKNWQQNQISNGEALTPPTEWPANHLQERLKAEALLDIRRAEKAKAEARIEEIKTQQKQKKKTMLQDGPVGKTAGGGPSRYDGPIVGVDGQIISRTDESIPFIDEPDSPYHGMALFDYKKMSRAWKDKHQINQKDLNRRAKAFREQMIQAGKKDEIPAMLTGDKFKQMMQNKSKWQNKHPEWPKWEAWPKMPEWPEDIKPINEIETEVDS